MLSVFIGVLGLMEENLTYIFSLLGLLVILLYLIFKT